MKFDMFYEVQSAKPWPRNHEQRLYQETIEQARAADRFGYETWWQVEHNATPEFSYSSAPDLWLSAVAQNTQRMRIGHSGIIGRFAVNHPMRAAARTATLDIISNGRLEVGLAVSGGREWATYGSDPKVSAQEYEEYFQMLPRIWTEESFSWDSPLIKIPRRNVVPKPIQRPHPALWQTAGSPASFRAAGRRGVGLLALTIFNPVATMKMMLDEYDAGMADCKKPVGHFQNKQKAVFTFVHVAESRKQAIDSGAALAALWYVVAGPKTFQVPLASYFALFGSGNNPRSDGGSDQYKLSLLSDGEPDPTNLEPEPWDNDIVALVKRVARSDKVSNEEAHDTLEKIDSVVIGDPDHCIKKLRRYEEIGTDRLMCMMQFGRLRHEAVMASIRLTSDHVVPAFR
jgi:alkanesulfonate monooxygenase SsuD/methylene tetrahydromethanopterin reductase-like flavin-dependent oxidoreductase (luciferase family)